MGERDESLGPVIRIENLTKTYRTGKVEVEALKGVSLTLERGEFVAVMGPSGSGKSTFLNLLGCLDHPTSGTFVLNGTDVSTLRDDELAAIRNRSIGFVFQGFNLLSRTSALHNIELPLVYTGNRKRGKIAHEMLEAVGLPERGTHTPSELSGGEQQRVAIARALVNTPAIILADEPTGNLDSTTSNEIMEIFRSLNRAGITILMVTHEEDVAAHAKRLVRFRDGRIVSDEPIVKEAPATGGGIDIARINGRHAAGNGRRGSVFSPGEVYENLRTAIRSLWKNRMRAILTALGILIGVGAVIAMVSVGQGASQSVSQRIEGLGSNLLTVIPGSMRAEGGVRQGFGSVTTLTYADAEAIRDQVPNVTGVAPEANSRVQLRYLRNTWSTSAVGTFADYPIVHNWPVASGTFFSDEDNKMKRNVAVIGQDIATNLFGETDPIGQVMKVGPVSFKVIGVLQKRGGGGFFSQDDTVLIPLQTAVSRFTGQRNIRNIAVSVSQKDLMNPTRDEITAFLRGRHKLADNVDNDFTIMSQEDILATAQSVTGVLTILLASIAGISLVVGGIGIMNIMLVSVTERTREIGIRKALGARRRDILSQFLTEAIILSAIGGLLGWALGALLATIVSKFGLATSISAGTVLLALGFSVAVGVFFGIYPAQKASRMDPIQALHFE
jgi:macrolide transport system ATP-binding/permease protein